MDEPFLAHKETMDNGLAEKRVLCGAGQSRPSITANNPTVKTRTGLRTPRPMPARDTTTDTQRPPPPTNEQAQGAPATTSAPPDAGRGDTPDGPGPVAEPRRDQMSALEVRAMVEELQALVGSYVDKAYQPTRDELLVRLRQPGVGRRDLYSRRGALVLLTTNPPPNPTKPSAFAMAVRRHASGGKIYRIEQTGFDRIITLHIQRRDDEFRIVLELFGDGNILLVRSDGRILLPLVHEAWKTRVLRPGATYEPPPRRADPTTFDEATFIEEARKGNRELVRAIAREVGLGGPVAEEIIARTGVDKNQTIETVDDATLKKTYASWESLRDEVTQGPITGRLLFEDERPVDCAPHQSALMEQEVAETPDRLRIETTPTYSAALDRLHLEGRRSQEAEEESRKTDEAKTKLQTQKEAQEEAIGKFARQEVESKRIGDLLYAHYQEIERILQGIHQARKEHDWDTIQQRLEEGKKSGNPDAKRIVTLEPGRGRLVVRLQDPDGQDMDVPLDITKNINENAEAAYTRSKSARSKLAGAKAALEQTHKRLEAAAEQAELAAEEAREVAARPALLIGPDRHHWFEGYRWTRASTGELIVGGRDAASNDRLVKKHLEENDRYVHADIHGAPSVIVKPLPDGTEVGEKALQEAGNFAVIYSRAFAQAGSADAYWATPMQVSKTPEAGEHLARGAFIVRGKRTWMRKLPMELTIGRVWMDRDGSLSPPPDDPAQAAPLRAKLMAGPTEAVRAHADRWVTIGPGDRDRREITKLLARGFDAHPDPVERLLPPGSLQIVTMHGVHVPDPSEHEEAQ